MVSKKEIHERLKNIEDAIKLMTDTIEALELKNEVEKESKIQHKSIDEILSEKYPRIVYLGDPPPKTTPNPDDDLRAIVFEKDDSNFNVSISRPIRL